MAQRFLPAPAITLSVFSVVCVTSGRHLAPSPCPTVPPSSSPSEPVSPREREHMSAITSCPARRLVLLPPTLPPGSLLPFPQLDSAINQERWSLVRDGGSRRRLSLPLSFICPSLAFNKFVPVNKPSKTDPLYLIKRRQHVGKYDT